MLENIKNVRSNIRDFAAFWSALSKALDCMSHGLRISKLCVYSLDDLLSLL